MHFSSPSGWRLSTCRPWKRGWVGTFSSGYCSVLTFLNIVLKVTPNPLMGSSQLAPATGHLLGRVLEGAHGGLTRHRRHGEAAGERVVRRGFGTAGVVLRRSRPERDDEEENDEDRAAVGEDVAAVGLVVDVDAH